MPRRAGTQRAGNRDRKIEIQRYESTRDEYGGEVQEWITVSAPWCELDPVRMTEMHMAAAERSSEIHVFRIPYTSDVQPKDRVMYEGLAYDIEGITEIGRRQVTQLTVRRLI